MIERVRESAKFSGVLSSFARRAFSDRHDVGRPPAVSRQENMASPARSFAWVLLLVFGLKGERVGEEAWGCIATGMRLMFRCQRLCVKGIVG